MPAATVRLFYEDCPFEHVAVQHSADAARLIEDGNTVCVPSVQEATETLILLGLTAEEARHQIGITAPRVREAQST